MNQVQLLGRLTRDPETRKTQSGITVSKYTLAVDRRFKKDGEPTADFINCTAFNKGAEFADKWLKKGTKIAVTGRIQTGSYQDKDGKKVYTTGVIVESQEFAESKKAETPEDYTDPFIEVPEDIDKEIPFR